MDTLLPTLDSFAADSSAAGSSADDSFDADGDRTCHAGLGAFCRRVGEIIDAAPEAEVPSRIAAVLPPLLATANLLTPEQRAVPPHGYARHDLFICPSEAFSVLAVVWPAGIISPIHDHKTWCAFGVYEGVIRETRYVQTAAAVVSTTDLFAGDVADLPVDAPDIHCMQNPTGEPAISIHVYAGDAGQLGPNVKNIYASET